MQRGKYPYSSLGNRLQQIRKQSLETIGEVSGAVELESEQIARIESGEERPSEDVLMLLISHFGIKDEEADELWELAGYADTKTPSFDQQTIPTLVVVPTDNRVLYTDTANVSINNFGVVLNFMQNGIHNQPVSVARIGMSMEHAKSVLEVLAKTIAQAEMSRQPKSLPSSTSKPSSKHGK
jgi:transcriptional regulator with XRE-family HTH domain